jgi:hypothetical protein
MRHRLLFRLMTCTALTVSAAFMSASLIPGGATAAELPLTVTCTALSGSGASQLLSHCTGTGAVAHEAGASPTHGTFVMSTWSITWADGRRSSLVPDYKVLRGSGNTCTTRPKYSKERMVIEAGYVRSLGTSTVGMIGGTIKATLCIYSLTASPHTVAVVSQGKIKI